MTADGMRVTMLTLGSRGDVQPLIAFALGLQRAGHRVRLATYPRNGSLVTGQGVEAAPLAEGAVSLGSETEEGRRWIDKGRRMPAWVGFIKDARSVADCRLSDAAAACQDADVVVANNLAQLLGWQMADHFRLPLVRVLFTPPTYWMARGAGGPLRSAIRQLLWLAARPWLNAVRRRALELPPLPVREPLGSLDARSSPALYPVSPAVFPVQPRLGEATGYWFLDLALDPDPPAELTAFLAAGPAPVYIGFGTNIDTDPRASAATMVSALRLAGCRGVLGLPPDVLGTALRGDDVFAVPSISHHWLFPRCAAVVHHAAAGTTATGLRAGVPTVPVPHHSDQFAWAKRIHELGVASAPIPRRKLSASALGEAIALVARDAAIRGRAAALGETIRAEHGVQRAVEHFERCVVPLARVSSAALTSGAPSASTPAGAGEVR